MSGPGRMHRAAVAVASVGLVALAACGSDAPTATASSVPRTAPTTTAAPGRTVPAPAVTHGSGDYAPVDDPKRDGSLEDVQVKAVRVASFASPTIVIGRPGSKLLYVAEREGVVRSMALTANGAGVVARQPVLDISGDTTTEGERGLLGLAFSADGSHLYVSHTNRDGNTRLEDYRMDGDTAVASTKRDLLAVDQPFPNHNGGNVVLGPDGMLWFGLGDGGSADDPDDRGQDPTDLLGKLLRIDPARPNDPEIWAVGLRNPWRFSFDRTTKDLWVGDVGQDKIEEVDFIPAGSSAGVNFGWSGYEGTQRFRPNRTPEVSVPPVFEMHHSDGWCSVTGGVVYRGTRIPDLVGTYLFGDYCKAGLNGLRQTDGVVTDERPLGPNLPELVSINEDDDGEVYLVSLDGGIYRLEAG